MLTEQAVSENPDSMIYNYLRSELNIEMQRIKSRKSEEDLKRLQINVPRTLNLPKQLLKFAE